MKEFQFRTHLREKRGGLRSFTTQMNDLYANGSEKLLEYMVRTKTIGIERALHYANELSLKEQDELVVYADLKGKNKDDIELKFLKIVANR